MPDTERMQQIRALLAEDPADPFLRYGLALEYAGQGDDQTAATHFRDLIAASPDYVPAYLMRIFPSGSRPMSTGFCEKR